MQTNQTALHPRIAAFVPMVEAITKLLSPYAEGAVHDLNTGTIVALFNNISKRKIGDPSVVAELGVEVKDFPDVFEPYYKTNWDDRTLKCVSVTVRDEDGTPIGLVCVNFDATVFETMHGQLAQFLATGAGSLNPIEQFAVDWRKQVVDYINAYVVTTNTALSAMTKSEKSELVRQLYAHGLFNYREAAAYVAKLLSVSRATIYNYLKEEKE